MKFRFIQILSILLLQCLIFTGCGDANQVGSGSSFVFTGTSSTNVPDVDLNPGIPAQLAFLVQPARTAGQSFDPAPTVQILDINGDLVIDATNPVTLTLSNAGPAVLSGTTTVNAVGGIASFPGLSVDIVGTDYVLTALSVGLTPVNSSFFVITPDVANGVFIATEPQTTGGGATMAPVVVQLRDAFGNLDTNSNAAVTVTLNALNGGTGTLGGTTTVNAISGVATFSDLTVDTAGQYTLTFTSAPLSDGTSQAFGVTVPVLFGTIPSQEVGNPSYLVRLDPTDGSFQTVGPTGGNFFPLVCTPDGRLLSAGNNTGSSDAELVEVNQATGQRTLIGTMSNNDVVGGCEDVRDLAFDSVTNTLYAIIDNCNGGANPGLFTVDLTTGAGTKLSDGSVAPTTSGQGLAANAAGVLFHTPADNLVSVNPADGVMTILFSGTLGVSNLTGLSFQQGTNTLFGADRVNSSLHTIDTAAGTLTNTFASAPGLDGIAFCESSVPFVDQTPVIDATIPLNFTDISGTGTPFFLGDDQATGLMPIGFDFTYFGQVFSTFDISSNGFLVLGNSTVAAGFTNEALPSLGNPNLVALYWEDLDPSDDGAPLFVEVQGTAPDRVLIVQYEEFDFFPGNGVPGGNAIVQAQAKFFEGSNIIEFHYATLSGADGGSATIGIQDGSSTRAAQFSFDTAGSVTSGSALRFTPPAP